MSVICDRSLTVLIAPTRPEESISEAVDMLIVCNTPNRSVVNLSGRSIERIRQYRGLTNASNGVAPALWARWELLEISRRLSGETTKSMQNLGCRNQAHRVFRVRSKSNGEGVRTATRLNRCWRRCPRFS